MKVYSRNTTRIDFRNVVLATGLGMFAKKNGIPKNIADKKVNEVTKTLFKKYKIPKDFANVKKTTFEREIRPTGFYKSKAKNIISNFNGYIFGFTFTHLASNGSFPN